jgi:hypothetical protein
MIGYSIINSATMRLLLLLITICITVPGVCFGQTKISELEPEQYFDFWIGEWELSWTDQQGNAGGGTNLIERTLGGYVIKENFEAEQGVLEGYIGKSWSVYNTQRQTWNQTWVDNNGGYIALEGSVDDDKRIFQTAERELPNGNTIINRMVFYDITEDSFTWDWESSRDSGESWSVNWQIKYERK